MTALLDWGASIILWLQQFQTSLLKLPMVGISWLGGTGFLLVLPLVIFAVDRRLGIRACLLFSASLYLNALIKNIVALPRPFETYPDIVSTGEHGFSFPSGHAQLAVVFWGLLAMHFRHGKFYWFAAAMVFLTGLSRVYLGVHYPSDVFTGWVLGAIILFSWLKFEPAVLNYHAYHGRATQLVWLFVTCCILALAALHYIDADVTLPGTIGFLAGCSIAGIAHEPSVDHLTSMRVRIFRAVVGLFLMFLMISALKKLAAWIALPSAVSVVFSLTILGGWVVGGIPTLLDSLSAFWRNRKAARAAKSI